tara:strand:+ start:5739 stop:5984 length:246 start_codon:yes stop_codon:yes gene_type:complete
MRGLCDQSGGIVHGGGDRSADKDCGCEKSGKSGSDLVLDVGVGHVDVPFWFNLLLRKLSCEDTNSIAQAVPVFKNLYISDG